MTMVVIPVEVHEEISRRLDALVATLPNRPSEDEIADIRAQIVSAYDRYGFLPEMSLQKTDTSVAS